MLYMYLCKIQKSAIGGYECIDRYRSIWYNCYVGPVKIGLIL